MSKYYNAIHVHSTYSLLDGLSKIDRLASRTEEIGANACALTDHGSVAGHIQFLKAMKKINKKPLLGCEFYVCDKDSLIKDETNRKLHHLCVIAKNTAGWKDLIELVSISNEKDRYYYKPRVSFDDILKFGQRKNLLCFSGHLGSQMSNILFDGKSYNKNWKKDASYLANKFRDSFGENFFLEVQLMDSMHSKEQKEVGEMIREIAVSTNIHTVATPDAHYATQQDAIDQRILLCSNMHVTMQQANKPDFGLHGFFRSSQFHIPTYEEMEGWHTQEELENTVKFADMVEDYDILKHPVLPEFKCPDGMNPDEYLRHLCREGWKEKIAPYIPKDKHQEYGDRVKKELEVLQGAGLSSYFLITHDILDYCKNCGWVTGVARGSSAGSLVSYLTGITGIDPIPYDLIFERFYNAGRNTEDHVSMPDIDVDVPKYARDNIINYIREKYGHDKVGQMVTFQTMKGRGAIKDVLRAYGGISFEEMNEITKGIVEEHKITDELQKMKEDTGSSSIIRWCLEHTPKKLEKWCTLNDKGELEGPLADRFAQAMRLEGTKTAQSKHPAGIVIAPEPLNKMCPLILDQDSGNSICGFEMEDLESVGGIKFDILGITALDKVMGIAQDAEFGEIHEIQRNY